MCVRESEDLRDKLQDDTEITAGKTTKMFCRKPKTQNSFLFWLAYANDAKEKERNTKNPIIKMVTTLTMLMEMAMMMMMMLAGDAGHVAQDDDDNNEPDDEDADQ